ncbi:DUF6221 family protein [Streptomyces olivaceiscleroticus]|uniref:Uncharacterized protein n=1 Tax=Streptomyces olivaceiscleroticus TaxID=68245 RepID=A0ABP3LI52_9ACTN
MTSELATFLRDRYAEDKRRAEGSRKVRNDISGRPCPRCGEPVDGWGSPLDSGVVRITHGGYLDGCDLTEEEWAPFGDDGITDEGAHALADVEMKLSLVGLCEPPLVETTGPKDTERQFMPGEGAPWGLPVLQRLASLYADHPDYRAEWRL